MSWALNGFPEGVRRWLDLDWLENFLDDQQRSGGNISESHKQA